MGCGLAVSLLPGLHTVWEQAYLNIGYTRNALYSLREYQHLGVVGGLMLAVGILGAQRIATLRGWRSLASFAALWLSLDAIALLLFEYTRTNANLFFVRTLAFVFLLAPALLLNYLRPPGSSVKALRRICFTYLGVEVLFLALHFVRLSQFINPTQLLPAAQMLVKAAVGLVVLWLLSTPDKLALPWRNNARRRGIVFWAIAGWAALLATNVALQQDKPDTNVLPNVLVIMVDALRQDSLPLYGYSRDTAPATTRFFEQGVVYTDAYAPAPNTKLSMAAVFTGLQPHQHGVTSEAATMPGPYLTLPEIFLENGYRTCMYNGGNMYMHKRFGYAQGFQQIEYAHRYPASQVVDDFLAQCGQEESEQPYFAYLHFMDVHSPYNLNPYNNQFGTPLELGLVPGEGLKDPNSLKLPQQKRRSLKDLYDGQILSLDHALKKVYQWLEQGRRLQNTIVVFFADHGEEFWEHGRFGHSLTLFEEILRVPLMLRIPGQSSGRVRGRVQIQQLYETLQTATRLPRRNTGVVPGLPDKYKPGADGRIIAASKLWGGPQGLFAVHAGTQKLIYNRDNWPMDALMSAKPDTRYFRVYDLATDPKETQNIAPDLPHDALMKARYTLLQQFKAPQQAPLQERNLSPQMIEQLRSLGYLQ